MAGLGDRKASEPNISGIDKHDILRRHFEAQFKPLDSSTTKTKLRDDDQDDSESGIEVDNSSDEDQPDEWGGLSESGDGDDNEDDTSDDGVHIFSLTDAPQKLTMSQDADNSVEVVDHSAVQLPNSTTMTKKELKEFMVGPPYAH